MVSKARTDRISQRIQEELSELFLFEITDPRLSEVYITHVNVDRELAFATISVSALAGAEVKKEILEGLYHAARYLRKHLANRIQLRSFPQLRFMWDSQPEDADRIDRLINSLDKPKENNRADDR